jgi:hypothetical protein
MGETWLEASLGKVSTKPYLKKQTKSKRSEWKMAQVVGHLSLVSPLKRRNRRSLFLQGKYQST